MSKEKTVMQELVETLLNESNDKTGFYNERELGIIRHIFSRAKKLLPKERQQIEEAYDTGWENGFYKKSYNAGKLHFNQKYGD
jgi:6-pyruvoyl-tetrahydropterin synthase